MMRRFFTWLVILCVIASCIPTQETEIEPTEGPFYAWDFTMNSLNGETYTLSELRGQYVIINFWATWCGPCRTEMPELQAISEDYADNFILLGINQREDVERVQAFADELELSFPLLINPPDDVLLNYQVINLPQTLIVDPNGELIWRRFGPINLDGFAEVLSDLGIQ